MTTKKIIERFLIDEAAELSGLTRSMVDYLCRQKVLVPSYRGRRGRGRPRSYTFGDVVMLRILARLLNAGVSVQRLKKALQSIRRYHNAISREALPAQFLVTNGRDVFLKDKEHLLELDGRGQMSFIFVIELNDARTEVLRAEERRRADGRT